MSDQNLFVPEDHADKAPVRQPRRGKILWGSGLVVIGLALGVTAGIFLPPLLSDAATSESQTPVVHTTPTQVSSPAVVDTPSDRGTTPASQAVVPPDSVASQETSTVAQPVDNQQPSKPASSKPVAKSTVVQPNTPPLTSQGQVIAKAGLNIRSGPGTNYSILGTAPYKATLAINGYDTCSATWWWVQYQGIKGWVSVDHVEILPGYGFSLCD